MGIRESTQLGIKKSASAMSNFLICNTNLVSSSFENKIKLYLFCGSINQYPPLSLRKEDQVWDGLPSANDNTGEKRELVKCKQRLFPYSINQILSKLKTSNVYGPFTI